MTGDNGANVRAGPGTYYETVGFLEPGDMAVITGRYEDWFQIDYEGRDAWVAGWTVTAKDADNVPQVAAPSEDAVLRYQSALVTISQAYSDIMTEIAELSNAASENPLVVLNEDWRSSTATALATLLSLGDEVRALAPPDGWQGVHAEMLSAVGHFQTMVDLSTEGLDKYDAALLRLAADELQLGNEALQRAVSEAERLAQQ